MPRRETDRRSTTTSKPKLLSARGSQKTPASRPPSRPTPRTEPVREESEPKPRTLSTSAREVKICGLNAVLAAFRQRPDDIVRAYVTEERIADARNLLKHCAQARKAYHVVTTEELAKITESEHHEGICILVKTRVKPLSVVLDDLPAKNAPAAILLLDRIANPHNLGAIVRVAAHFGVHAIITDASNFSPSPALYRTAEGGMEHVQVVAVKSLVNAAHALQEAGFALVATSSHARKSLFKSKLPRQVAFMLGSESEGLDPHLAKMATATLAVPGTGAVESLNVACAATALLTEFWRTQHEAAPHAES